MKKILFLSFVLSITLISVQVNAADHPLYAGQDEEVGHISVNQVGDILYVDYIIDEEDWAITETHLHVADALADIPQNKNGNPKNGKFDYGDSFDPAVTEAHYEIDVSGLGSPLYIAAHAVVKHCVGDFEALEEGLPAYLPCMKVTYHNFPYSYFDILVDSLHFDGFCINTGIRIGQYIGYNYLDYPVVEPYLPTPEIIPAPCLEALVFSSYNPVLQEPAASCAIDYPENLPKVNWILNNLFPDETTPYTASDIQRAIWEILDDNLIDPYGHSYSDPVYYPPGTTPPDAGLVFPSWGPLEGSIADWDQNRVNRIVWNANNNESFVPGCGDVVGIVVVPINPDILEGPICDRILQPIIVTIPMPCYCYDETAWGDGGYDFSGNNWATYITYTLPQ